MTMNQRCPVCRGRGTDGNGRRCQACGGAGEVSPKAKEGEGQKHIPSRDRRVQTPEKSLRKRLISPIRQVSQMSEPQWLELDREACVEVTSEDSGHPIEGALVREDKRGWRAAEAGTQVIRLIFDNPQNIERIELVFDENQAARTQEFVLQWMPKMGHPREIVRQQWNFSPPGNVQEAENFSVQLSAVSTLELVITPDISGGEHRASLSSLRVAGITVQAA